MPAILVALCAFALAVALGFGFWIGLVGGVLVFLPLYWHGYRRRMEHARAWIAYCCGQHAYTAWTSFQRLERISNDLQSHLSRHEHGGYLHGLLSPYSNVRDPGQVRALLRHLYDADADVLQYCFMSRGRPFTIHELASSWEAWLRLYSHAKLSPFFARERTKRDPVHAAS